jgi:type III secretion system YscQ/HrcQ family protein
VTDVGSTARDAFDHWPAFVWPFRVAAGDVAGEVSLWIAARALARSAERSAVSISRFEGCVCRVAIVAARQKLFASEVAALSIDDLLVLDRTLRTDSGNLSGTVWLCAGAIEIPVTATSADWTIAGSARTRSATMDNEAHEPAVNTAVMGELPIDTEIVLAQRTFRLDEIAAWRVGEVVPFAARVGDGVSVRAGGRVIARGELCDVEGELAVRITERLA